MPARPRYEEIAQHLLARLRDGTFVTGEPLPTETALAAELDVARGTLRRALERIESTHGLVVKRGNGWIARERPLVRSLDVLGSFGEWARAIGVEPAGEIVRRGMGRATPDEAHALRLRPRDGVLRITRVRSLRDRPVMVARTTFPERFAALVEPLPADVPSIMAALSRDHGVRLRHAEQLIGALTANAEDARLLRRTRGEPLLRIVRTARAADGTVFEYSDDRYLPDSVSFALVTSAPGSVPAAWDRTAT
ncbi:GntR family transcriptional regulator [Microbacterium betulae]|uniref:GntR family transcriptional regulator n=1 Tax=Microbacterium betulae TaxID=2981139 RepID=A0AA97FJ73_9MICO|nr:GntR family transcriptional regulator [Microbacterium sp. AB]WOF22537.1 GntR family transcriptional regulator [Microbacterium sp. AB]